MRTSISFFLFILLIFSCGLISCVSKGKYMALQKDASTKTSILQQENVQFKKLNDSLSYVLAKKDSIIDSLTVKVGEALAKREKSKNNGQVKKSTLSKEQEYTKKSLFIYNFTKYIEWPIEYNGTDFIIGVNGDDDAVKQLQTFMFQKKVSGKKITVEKFKKGTKYNIVYTTSSALAGFNEIRKATKRTKTLLLTDDNIIGCHISFLIDQDKIRYLVDKMEIEKCGLKVGQELMRYSG